MTKGEAIKILSDIRADYSCFDDDERLKYHALSMAIEALEERTEAVTDCISRERAIEIVKRAETKEIAYLALINLEPKEIPTCNECRLPKCLADKQNDWIPVSDRLPEKYKQIVCCDKQGRVFTSALTHISGDDGLSFGKHHGVIAWKPLPAPYKESEE